MERKQFALRLQGKRCISCGVCMDVCMPGALDMRRWNSATVEGAPFTYLRLNTRMNSEIEPAPTMSFPYLKYAGLCNGCKDCVRECPVGALDIVEIVEAPEKTSPGE